MCCQGIEVAAEFPSACGHRPCDPVICGSTRPGARPPRWMLKSRPVEFFVIHIRRSPRSASVLAMLTAFAMLPACAPPAQVGTAADPEWLRRGAATLQPFKESLMAALQEGLQQGPVEAIQVCRVRAAARRAARDRRRRLCRADLRAADVPAVPRRTGAGHRGAAPGSLPPGPGGRLQGRRLPRHLLGRVRAATRRLAAIAPPWSGAAAVLPAIVLPVALPVASS